jgi:hypothetical protein
MAARLKAPDRRIEGLNLFVAGDAEPELSTARDFI